MKKFVSTNQGFSKETYGSKPTNEITCLYQNKLHHIFFLITDQIEISFFYLSFDLKEKLYLRGYIP